MTDHLLKEVDDALKLHRLEQLWRKYGQQIVLGVAIAAISLIALLIWKQQQQAALQAQSDILLRALAAQRLDADLPDMSSLSQAHAQLGILLKNPENDADLLQAKEEAKGNALLANYACLLASQQNADISCNVSAAFTPLAHEFMLVRLLHSGDVAQADALLKTIAMPQDPMAQRRLQDLRSYVQSSLLAHLPTVSAEEKFNEASDAE